MTSSDVLRVSIIQPALTSYRIAVFEQLSRISGIDLTVLHGAKSNVHNVSTTTFRTQQVGRVTVNAASLQLGWLSDQIRYASPKRSDVLVLEWNLHNLSLVPALVRARASGVRSILWGHGYSLRDSASRSYLRAKVGTLADAAVLYDPGTARRYVDEHGYSAKRVFVAENALDQKPLVEASRAWSRDPDQLARFQRDQGIADRPVILHLSRMRPERHLGVLVRAISLIVQKHPEAIAVLIGDGEPEKARLQALAREVGVEGSVRFIDAIYDEERLAPWFMSSLAFCSPGHLGLAIFHAFGYGLPVVAGNAIRQHPPEARALVNGRNGLLFEHDNPTDLASVLSRLIENPQFAARMGSNALDDVTHRYTIDKMVDRLEAAIRGDAPT